MYVLHEKILFFNNFINKYKIIFQLKNLDEENSYCKNLLFIVCDFEI